MGDWTSSEKRTFLMNLMFIAVILILLGCLMYMNTDGSLTGLIKNIILVFLGVAGHSASNLTSGKYGKLTERVAALEKDLEKCKGERAAYKEMFDTLNQKLVEQSGILDNILNGRDKNN